MKRLVVYLIRQPELRKAGYVLKTVAALEKAGLSVSILCEGKLPAELAEHHAASVPGGGLAGALRNLPEAEELVMLDDRLMGPLNDLADWLSRADAFEGDAWVLARRAPMVGLRSRARANKALLTALLRGETDLLAVCKAEGVSAGELYDTSAMASLTEDPLLDEPLRMARDVGCPFFLHKVFHRDYDEVIIRTLGHQAQVFYKWLMEKHPVAIDPLWDYLLANCHQEDLFFNMKLCYVLPTKGCHRTAVEKHLETHPLALVMHLYYEDKLPEAYAYAARFPASTHLYVTTNTEEKRQAILKILSPLPLGKLDVRVIANRGRDVSSLLVGVADIYDRYEYVCFFHDKKTLQTKPGSIGAGFAHKCAENMFGSRDYVYNVIRLFAENPRLGMVAPPPPHHADYFFTLGTAWGPNYKLTKNLRDQLGFTAPIAEDKLPLAPLGTCFWFRAKALKPLLSPGWTYEDFPPEPNNADGTILHAMERIYPFSGAEAGYYPAYVLTDRYAKVEYTSMRYYVRGYNEVCFKHGILSYHRNMREEIARRLR